MSWRLGNRLTEDVGAKPASTACVCVTMVMFKFCPSLTMFCFMSVDGLQGASQRALSGMEDGAGRVLSAARALQDGVEPEAAIELRLGARQHEVNATVVKAVDELMGDLIDILA